MSLLSIAARRSAVALPVALGLALWSVAASLAGPTDTADSDHRWTIIVFRNGQQVRGDLLIPRSNTHAEIDEQGRLIYRSDLNPDDVMVPETIRFQVENGPRLDYPASRIERVILPQEQAAAEASELITQIRQQFFIQGDLTGAISRATDLWRLQPQDPEVRALCQDIAWAVFQQARQRVRAGQVEASFEFWDPLVVFLTDTGLPLVDVDAGAPVEVDLRDQMHAEIAQALRTVIQELLQRASRQTPPDRALLNRATDYNARLLSSAPDDYEARKNEMLITQLRGDIPRALALAEALQRDFPTLPFSEQQLLQLTISNLRSQQGQAQATPPTGLGQIFAPPRPTPPAPEAGPGTPTPGPTRTPAPGVAMPGVGGQAPQRPPIGVSAQPSDTAGMPAVAAPTGAGRSRVETGLWARLRRQWTSRNWGGLVNELTRWAGNNQTLVTGLGVALAAVLVLWILPHRLAQRAARRGSVPASIWAPRIKRWGPVAAVGWLVSPLLGRRRAREPKAETLCPHCSGDVSNVDLYRDLNFLACPHCGEAITPVFGLNDYIANLIRQIDRVRGGRALGEEFLGNVIERESMLRLTRAIMTQAVRRRASDLHVDATGEGLDLRIRVDGVMTPMDVHVPKAVERAFVSAFKVMADLDITERRAPQDGRFEITVDGTPIDVRINTSPTGLGEKISMRLLDSRTVRIPIERLGISEEAMPGFRRAYMASHGLMLVTGPTGCGKSTTLYVVLNEINDGKRNIVTIEDPIEFIFRGLNQHQVNPAAGFTFATGLRSIIRQDPDVIMVGEIRDRETADIAVDAAATGHLVMTTLHTIDAAGAYQRLAEFGVDPRRFAPSLLLIVAQRLIRIICAHCKDTHTPDAQVLRQLDLGDAAKDVVFHAGKGCERCAQTGYHGRTGLFEVMVINEELRQLMEAHSPLVAIREAAKRNGMRTLREEGILRVLRGQTTPEEVLRVIS